MFKPKNLLKKNTDDSKIKKKRFFIRFKNASRYIAIFSIYIVLTAIIATMLLARITGTPELRIPEKTVSTFITPVQTAFTNVVEYFANYIKKLKVRGNLEEEYNKLLAQNEKLVYEAMLANELQIQLSQYKTLVDEVTLNESMNPIVCRVVGRESGNYFNVFTINKGQSSGIKDFMAVTVNGALVGYTYNVSINKCDVRTIIDSEASIAALIQTSRDQGTIRGTLGIDGKPMCRMYYLPNENLPRPGDEVVTSGVGMSFPKGIPIGTVRESTRRMEENKQYIVVEPKVDFSHIENVIVLRYQPDAIGVTAMEDGSKLAIYYSVPTSMPVPTIQIGKDQYRLEPTYTPVPENFVTPEPSESDIIVTSVPSSPVPTNNEDTGFTYNVPNATENPIQNYTLAPTATPEPTEPPLNITVEDEE